MSTSAGVGGSVDGDVLTAQYSSLVGMATNSNEDTLYLADSVYLNIRQLDLSTMVMTTIAGEVSNGYVDGFGSAAGFLSLSSLSFDLSSTLYVGDSACVRSVAVWGFVSTVAGVCGGGSQSSVDGDGTNAEFMSVDGVYVNARGDGAVYVSDMLASNIRRVLTTYPFTVSTLMSMASVDPTYLVIDWSGSSLYEVGNSAINKVVTSDGSLSLVAGVLGTAASSLVDGVGTNALFGNSLGLAIDATGSVYDSDRININGDTLFTIRKIDPSSGTVVTLASYLEYTGRRLIREVSVAFHAYGLVATAGGTIYVSDAWTSSIKTLSTGVYLS
jgi:hypothetical protein